MEPTIGRIVHYGIADVQDGVPTIVAIPAMITKVNSDGTVALTLFDVTDVGWCYSAPHSETLKEKHWMWPPRNG